MKKNLNIRINDETYDELKSLSEKSNIKMSDAIRAFIDFGLKKYKEIKKGYECIPKDE